jgi:hypothetical protein
VLVATSDHAFVLCGYRRTPRDQQPDWITFVRHDDQRGPYLTVDDIFNDTDPDSGYNYSPWEALIVPLPDKLWLPPEPAEYTGGMLMQGLARLAAAQVPDVTAFEGLIREERLALRTYALTSNQFKSSLPGRVDDRLVQEYRLARMSRYVWVVEAVDRERRRTGQPCVVGEAIFDATSSEHQPDPLAIHVPGLAMVHRTRAQPRFPIRCAPDPYESGGVGPP